jgi:hypothetical protein
MLPLPMLDSTPCIKQMLHIPYGHPMPIVSQLPLLNPVALPFRSVHTICWLGSGGCAHSSRVIEYPIWDWDLNQQGDSINFANVVGWRLDIGSVLATQLRAIAAYRSQTTNLIDDDPDGFQLTPAMLANFARP